MSACRTRILGLGLLLAGLVGCTSLIEQQRADGGGPGGDGALRGAVDAQPPSDVPPPFDASPPPGTPPPDAPPAADAAPPPEASPQSDAPPQADVSPPSDAPSTAGWAMTFHDEFDGTSVDPSKWNFTYRWDDLALLGNGEQQWYAPDAVTVSGGLMHFTTTKEDYYWPKMGTTQHYRSGMVASYDKFSQQYGYFVIRAKMPAGQGFWPAFWLLPQSGAWPPEIDVLEILGHQPERVYMTFHYNNPDHQSNGTYYDISPSSAAAFHTYGVEWSAGAIVWYIDEVEHHRVTQFIPTEPFYIIANLTVGGYWPGNPDGTTPFPSVMDVDYIRVYERQAGSTDPVPGP